MFVKQREPVPYWQSLAGISHSSLLVKRHNNSPKTNPNPNPNTNTTLPLSLKPSIIATIVTLD